MRYRVIFGLLLAGSGPAWGGPIFDQFGSGYEGVSWGLSLVDLVGMLPQGEHYFANAPGQRDYAVQNDAPLLGVPRAGTRTRYYLDRNDRVQTIAVGVPYDRYQQLLGVLVAQFGRYSRVDENGPIAYYWWAEDQPIRMSVRVTKDPRYGMAEFELMRVEKPTPKVGGK